MKFEDVYITMKIVWRNKICYVLNIFQSGIIVISPKGENKIYHVKSSDIKC